MKKMCVMFLLPLSMTFLVLPPVRACNCEGDPPGYPWCFECQDGVWVVASYAQCATDAGCPGCQGCNSNCECQDWNPYCASGHECCAGYCNAKSMHTYTESARTVSCPYCSGTVLAECGSTQEYQSYTWAMMQEDTGGVHSYCYSAMLTAGYIYSCTPDWDMAKMVECAERGAWCLAVCVWSKSPSMCGNCLATQGAACCSGGPCTVCDFVSGCVKDTSSAASPIQLPVMVWC
jgi:hypothetical protein